MKIYDFTPGASNISPFWIEEINNNKLPYQRGGEFRELLSSLEKKLKTLTNFDEEILFINSSGTGAIEVIIGALNKNINILVISNGVFGNRVSEIVSFHLPNVFRYNLPDNISLSKKHLPTIKNIINKEKIDLVTCVHVETSTGILNDINILNDLDVFTIVDGISAIGNIPVDFNKIKVDCYVSVSWKCLMAPVGASIIFLKNSLKSILKSNWSYYFNLNHICQKNKSSEFLWTASRLSLRILNRNLSYILNCPNFFNILESTANSFRKNLNSIEVYGKKEQLSNCYTNLIVQDSKRISSKLESEYRIMVGTGISVSTRNHLRIAHYANADTKSLIILIKALKELILS